MSGYFWAEIESSWSSGVHGANFYGRSHIVRMSKWLMVLPCGSCDLWHKGRHGGELYGLYVDSVLLCIQLPSPSEYIAKIQASYHRGVRRRKIVCLLCLFYLSPRALACVFEWFQG
jgi:hypothetical protein